jgi:hypothetical protein
MKYIAYNRGCEFLCSWTIALIAQLKIHERRVMLMFLYISFRLGISN